MENDGLLGGILRIHGIIERHQNSFSRKIGGNLDIGMLMISRPGEFNLTSLLPAGGK